MSVKIVKFNDDGYDLYPLSANYEKDPNNILASISGGGYSYYHAYTAESQCYARLQGGWHGYMTINGASCSTGIDYLLHKGDIVEFATGPIGTGDGFSVQGTIYGVKFIV